MMKLEIGGQEYKLKFGYNCFCDTDIMERVQSIATLFQKENINSDQDAVGLGKIKELFSIVRELIFWGMQRYNPVGSLEEVGDLLDQYKDEGEEKGEDRGLNILFTELFEELMNAGFLSDLMTESSTVKKPSDRKKAKK